MIEVYLLCGYIGSALFTINLIPQIYKIYKTKQADDISYWWQLSYLGATGFSMVFAYRTPYLNIKIGLTIEMMNVLLIMYLKRLYSNRVENLPKE